MVIELLDNRGTGMELQLLTIKDIEQTQKYVVVRWKELYNPMDAYLTFVDLK